MYRALNASLIASLTLGGSTLLAQGVPALSPPFLVNSYTTGGQSDPDVACDGNGNFVVVWDSSIDPAFREVRGQLFDAVGSSIGGEFPVNGYTFADQSGPRVAVKSDGNFVVVWQGTLPNLATGISLRRFGPTGNPLGNDFVVAGDTSGAYARPAIASNEDGFVVAWQSSIVPMVTELRGQRFDWDGAPVGALFTVASGLHYPEVAMDSTGRFAVTWSDGDDVRARVYLANGTPVGPDFQVNTYTTNAQRYPSVALDDDGSFVVVWQTDISGSGNTDKLRGQRFDAAANPVGPELVLAQNSPVPRIVHRSPDGYVVSYGSQSTVAHRYDDSMQPIGDWFYVTPPGPFSGGARMAPNNGRHVVFTFSMAEANGDGFLGVYAARGGFPDWASFKVDERPATGGSSNVNGVIEAGERVTVDSAYLNLSGSPYLLSGTASNFTGDAGPVYSIPDSSADYGTVPASLSRGHAPAANTADCFTASGNCFEFEIAGTRPQGLAHWDAKYDEALSEQVTITRTIHVGGSFADVPGTNPFVKYVENLFHNGITAGGSCGGYCPTDGVKRQQMAVFLLKSELGKGYFPPAATGTIFADVPLTNPFASWIEDLYNRGVTGGCASNPLQFCPDAIVNRQQMAVFLLKAYEGAAYDPPDCVGIFTDVTCTPGTGFSDWIEELYNRQITGGCVLNPLQYCPTNPTNRQQMAAFLSKNFGLVLYGP